MKRSRYGVVLVAACLVVACDHTATGPSAAAPPIGVGPATVTLSPEIDPQVTARVAALVSATDSASPVKGNVLVPSSGTGSLVLAVTAAGSPMLGGFASQSHALSLGYESTADALVHLAWLPVPVSATAGQAEAAMRNAPSYGALVALVANLARAGASPFESDSATSLAIQVASEAAGAMFQPPLASRSAPPNYAASASPNRVYLLKGPLFGTNVWVGDPVAGGVNLYNQTRISWEAYSTTEDGTAIQSAITVAPLRFDFFEFIPYYNPPAPTPVATRGNRFVVGVRQSQATQSRNATQVVTGFVESVLSAAGMVADEAGAGKCATTLVGKVFNSELSTLLTEPNGASAQAYLVDGVVKETAKDAFFGELLSDCGVSLIAKPTGFRSVLKVVLKSWGKVASGYGAIQTATGFAGYAEYVYQTFHYWDTGAQRLVCESDGDVASCEFDPAQYGFTLVKVDGAPLPKALRQIPCSVSGGLDGLFSLVSGQISFLPDSTGSIVDTFRLDCPGGPQFFPDSGSFTYSVVGDSITLSGHSTNGDGSPNGVTTASAMVDETQHTLTLGNHVYIYARGR